METSSFTGGGGWFPMALTRAGKGRASVESACRLGRPGSQGGPAW